MVLPYAALEDQSMSRVCRAKNISRIALFLLCGLFNSLSLAQQNTLLQDIPNSYTSFENLVNMPDGRAMGSGNAVDIDSVREHLGFRALWRQ